MVALSPFSVNTEKGPPEAQDAIANLLGEFPQIRTACQRADVGIGPYGGTRNFLVHAKENGFYRREYFWVFIVQIRAIGKAKYVC